MPTIANVAAQLIAVDLPVVFLDTCILLDVIRSIERRYANCVAKAADLYAAITMQPAQCSMGLGGSMTLRMNAVAKAKATF